MHDIRDCKSVEIRLAHEDDINRFDQKELPLLSYSSITNYHTCPTYGIITKSCGRAPTEAVGRQTALEAGSVSHEVFAAARIHQLIMQDLPGHAWHHAKRIFGESRRDSMWKFLDNSDHKLARYNFAMEALYTSGYTDDPFDKRRTFAAIEESMMHYLGYFDTARYPVFVLDHNDVGSFVGIEVPVILYVNFVFEDGTNIDCLLDGFLDGLHYDAKDLNRIIVVENKTASRITDSWANSFIVDHQITIYALMATLVMHREITDVHVYGSPIPIGRQTTTKEPVHRHRVDHHHEMLNWVLEALEVHYRYKDDPLNATRRTHSCGRYFRSCSMLPVCASPREDRQEMFDMLPVGDNSHTEDLIRQYLYMKDTYANVGV